MEGMASHSDEHIDPEPRWPAILGLLAIGVVNLAIPERLSFGPNWLVLSASVILLFPTIAAWRKGKVKLSFILGLVICGLTTAALIWSLLFLIAGIPDKRQPPSELMRAAVLLWFSNILVFASWYWRLDAGGPHNRDLRHTHTQGAFLFPQMTLPDDVKSREYVWKPGFVDYLFLAFNTSTAFSPSDTPILTVWAKVLTMLQATISLATIAILAARAIGTI